MKLLQRLFSEGNNKKTSQNNQSMNIKLIEDNKTVFNEKLVKESDIIKSCIRPKVKTIGKLGVFITQDGETSKDDKDLNYILKFPNEVDTLQTLLERLITQLQLSSNAFAVIIRDINGKPINIIPSTYDKVEMVESESKNLYVKFTKSRKEVIIPYNDVIHLRSNIVASDFFGDSPDNDLEDLLHVITMTDQSLKSMISNSAKPQLILKYKSALRPEDIEKEVEEFKRRYLDVSNHGGVAGVDSKYDITELNRNIITPDTSVQMEKIERIYRYFGVNKSIVENDYTEDQWNAFYEAEIEPLIIALSNEFSRKLLSTVDIYNGKQIIFSSTGLQFSSMKTKLKLTEFVDRGLVSPNEVRKIMNLPSIDEGDNFIRRLDTARVDDERFNNLTDSKDDKKQNNEDENGDE